MSSGSESGEEEVEVSSEEGEEVPGLEDQLVKIVVTQRAKVPSQKLQQYHQKHTTKHQTLRTCAVTYHFAHRTCRSHSALQRPRSTFAVCMFQF